MKKHESSDAKSEIMCLGTQKRTRSFYGLLLTLGDVRGVSTNHRDRLPMSADILAFEHFLLPGTLIVVDGRTANARFLATNLQRNWVYSYSKEYDQHFFELKEPPLGIYNQKQIEFCLGEAE